MSDPIRSWPDALQEFFDHGGSDLKTLLNIILHFSNELLHDENLTEDQQEKASYIYASAKRLREVFDDFLLLGQLETGARQAKIEPVDLYDLVQKEWIGNILANFTDKEIKTSFHLAPNLSLVQADKFGLKYIISRCVTLDPQMNEIEIVAEQDGKWVKLKFIGYPCQFYPVKLDEVENFNTYKTIHFGMQLIIASLFIQAINGQFKLENLDADRAFPLFCCRWLPVNHMAQLSPAQEAKLVQYRRAGGVVSRWRCCFWGDRHPVCVNALFLGSARYGSSTAIFVGNGLLSQSKAKEVPTANNPTDADIDQWGTLSLLFCAERPCSHYFVSGIVGQITRVLLLISFWAKRDKVVFTPSFTQKIS